MIKKIPAVLLLFILIPAGLAACESEANIPLPVELTRAANGNYCGMIIADHPGPKAQVHEKERGTPLWFSSVRDALAYMRLPGEAQNVSVIYVHDMGRAKSWATPGNKNIWIKAEKAIYVIASSRRGGMGAREAIPFLDRSKAMAFIKKYGGKIAAYSEIPDDYILGDEGEHNRQSHTGDTPQS